MDGGTVGERLREGIERFGPPRRGRPGAKGGIQAFHARMEEMAAGGTIPATDCVSYQMLHRYLPKESNPDPALPTEGFLRAAAKVLSAASGERVRWEWLASGRGSPTEKEQRARQTEEEANAATEWLEDVVSQVVDGADEYGPALLRTGLARAMVTNTWRRLIFTERGGGSFLDGSLAGRIGEALAAPARAMGVDPDSLSEQALSDYLQAATLALRHLHPEPPAPSPSIRTTEKEETDGEE